MSENFFMGIDIGTSGVRAALFNEKGYQKSLYHKEYPLISLQPGMAELDPDQVFNSLIDVVKNCLAQIKISKENILSIGLSTQMHSILPVDKQGKPLSNLFTWADNRAEQQSKFISINYDTKELYRKTGCRTQHPMYPISKILWLKETNSALYSNTYKFISIKEYIIYKLYNEYVIDITDASASACFNINEFKWDEDILKDILNINTSKLGTPMDITYTLNNMNKVYADAMGILPNTPLALGSGDGMMANLGCGVFDSTRMSSTIGTSGAMRISSDKPIIDPDGKTWCYNFTKDTWVAGGAINNGGIVLKWMRDEYKAQFESEMIEMGEKKIYKLFDTYAEQVSPASDELIFLTYLTGERSPGWHANAPGVIHGLRLLHGKKHYIRAAMEGVMYNMYSIYEAVTALNNNVKTIIANGGYANSPIWLQIQADIFNKDIAVADVSEAAALGAAYTGMVAIKYIQDFKQLLPAMKTSQIVNPIQENNEIYKNAYEKYQELYLKLIK